jgi:hypothetical protein
MTNRFFDYADRFCSLLFDETKLPLTIDNFILLLADKQSYPKVYNASAWLAWGDYTQKAFSQIISGFVKEHATLIKRYLRQEYTLTTICQTLAQFIFANKMVLNKDEILKCLVHGDAVVDQQVFRAIRAYLKPKETINLLGFGSNQGNYENFIAKFLLDKQLAHRVNIYGFDPYSASFADNIIPLSIEALEQPSTLSFDLIIARWVLHHVSYQERWHTFIKFTNALSKNGLILVLEEGSLAPDKQALKELMYRFYLGCVDVVINIGLRPEWLLATHSAIGENFFVDYLTQTDFKALEAELKFNYKTDCYALGNDQFFSQNLIIYAQTN